MRVEIISIGNELLNGKTVNSNAQQISKSLFEAGISVCSQTTVGDNLDDFQALGTEVFQRADIVVSTGGLGLTLDDVTRSLIQQLFCCKFCQSEKVRADLEKRFGKNLATIENQSTVPDQAKLILNSIGTAPGLIMEKQGKLWFFLPGVPCEMLPMLKQAVIPFIKKRFPNLKKQLMKSLHLFELFESDVDPVLRKTAQKYPSVQFGIYPALGLLHLNLISEDQQGLQGAFTEIETAFASNCFESESGKIEETVQNVFIENGWTLSLAESITGGFIASSLTSCPGASNYFLGSVVSYANSVKKDMLNIADKTLKESGAVSQEVVLQMAEGVQLKTGSDFSVAISGIAGPSGGSSEKPVGTVWFAISQKGGKIHSWKMFLKGSRQTIIERCKNAVLAHLLQYIKETSLI